MSRRRTGTTDIDAKTNCECGNDVVNHHLWVAAPQDIKENVGLIMRAIAQALETRQDNASPMAAWLWMLESLSHDARSEAEHLETVQGEICSVAARLHGDSGKLAGAIAEVRAETRRRGGRVGCRLFRKVEPRLCDIGQEPNVTQLQGGFYDGV